MSGNNWEQERAAIDRGRRGDKTPAEDPAAAPLGADEEAAGARTPPEQIGRPPPAPEAPHGGSSGSFLIPGLAIGAVALAVAIALLAPLF